MYIHVKLFPQSKKEKIEIKKDEYLYIYVKEKAEQNKANKQMQDLLAKKYNITPKEIHIISGHHRPKKIIEIKKMS